MTGAARGTDDTDAGEETRLAARGRVPAKFVTLRWIPSRQRSCLCRFGGRDPDLPAAAGGAHDLAGPGAGRAGQGIRGSIRIPATRFVSTGRNERIEVIRDTRLDASFPGGLTTFSWTQQLRLVSEASGGGLSYEYVGDGPGAYTFRLVADRVITGQPLSNDFTVSLAGSVIEFLDQRGPERVLTFALD